MKWLTSGYPGSVAWLVLPALLTRSARHGITILRHNEMDALWFPRISLAWLALPALLTRSAVGMESRFFATIKWLPSGFPESVAWLALPRQEDDMESQFATMKWLPSGFPG